MAKSGTRLPAHYAASIMSGEGDDRFWTWFPSMLQWVPPVFVNRAGLARWKAGRSWQGRNSGRVGLELVTAGDAEFIQENRRTIVHPGSLYIPRAQGEHLFRTGPSGYLHKRYVYIDGPQVDFMMQSLGLATQDVVRISDRASLSELFRQTYRVLAIPDDSWEKTRRLAGLAYDLLLEVARNAVTPALSPEVQRAMEFMNRNLNRNLTLAQIAARNGMSVYHFSRTFTQAVRTSPMKYFLSRRMAYASRMLTQTSLSIKEIATVCGFENSYYFATQFKRHHGVPPSQFRAGRAGRNPSPQSHSHRLFGSLVIAPLSDTK